MACAAYLTGLLPSLNGIVNVWFFFYWFDGVYERALGYAKSTTYLLGWNCFCFSKRAESNDKSRVRWGTGPHAATGSTQEKKDFRLKVAVHSIKRVWHALSPRALPMQRETIGNRGGSELPNKMLWKLSSWSTCLSHVASQCSSSHLSLPSPISQAGHSVVVLLGKPSFHHLYFNICSLSWMKHWKFIYNHCFDSPPYQLPLLLTAHLFLTGIMK